jgi:hypothetical protein
MIGRDHEAAAPLLDRFGREDRRDTREEGLTPRLCETHQQKPLGAVRTGLRMQAPQAQAPGRHASILAPIDEKA